MKNFIIAFTVSIVIHFVLLYSLKDVTKQNFTKPSASKTINKKYTYINLAKIKKIQPIKKTTINNEQKREIIKKKIVKKQTKKKKKVIYKKVIKKNLKTDKRKTAFTNKPINKSIAIVKKNIKPINIEKPLLLELPKSNYTLGKKEQKEFKNLDKLTLSYIKLYGQEYFNYSEDTKKYLKENLNKIGQITQQYLMYPSVAIRTKQKGMNIVQFLFKPNGDIEDLKIIDSSQYSLLDKNTIKTIKIAYKDYPKPKENTLIKIYVKYVLY